MKVYINTIYTYIYTCNKQEAKKLSLQMLEERRVIITHIHVEVN